MSTITPAHENVIEGLAKLYEARAAIRDDETLTDATTALTWAIDKAEEARREIGKATRIRERAAARIEQEKRNAAEGRESLFAQPNRYEF